MEDIAGAIISQEFIAEIIEEYFEDGVEEANVEELTVRMRKRKEERRKKRKKRKKRKINNQFEFKIMNEEMQHFAEEELAKNAAGNVESANQAFMENIEVQSKLVDKSCARCVDFVAKCDRYALHNSNLITDLEKSRELIVALSSADKEYRSRVIALKKDITEFERRLA
ncbi:hypothetical protein Hanom_Chr12g01141081 [Helianthus anomalus]